MLVLSRQRDETIMIGDDVEITIVDIRGDKVRLGITAPREIQVHRKEVYDAIKRENKQAAKLRPRDVSEVVERDADKKNAGKKASDASETGPQGEVSGNREDKAGERSSEDKEIPGSAKSNNSGRSR